MNPTEKHDAIMQQLDEIKRYVAGTFSKVDTEIDDIRKVVDRLDGQIRDISQRNNRGEQIENMLRNVESTVREIQRKIK